MPMDVMSALLRISKLKGKYPISQIVIIHAPSVHPSRAWVIVPICQALSRCWDSHDKPESMAGWGV